MQAEWPLEVNEDIVSVRTRIVLSYDAVRFHRRAGIARIAHVHHDAMRSFGKRAVGIPVAERTVARDIRAQALVQHLRIGGERRARLHHDRQRVIVDLDQVKRVLSDVAAGRDDHRDRLTDIAHAVDRDRPALDRRAHADDKARPVRLHLRCRDDGPNAGQRAGGFNPDRTNVRMRMRRAQDCGMERAGAYRQIIEIAPCPAQERRVLDPLDRAPEPGVERGSPHLSSLPARLTLFDSGGPKHSAPPLGQRREGDECH
jgi:hypothetical protein